MPLKNILSYLLLTLILGYAIITSYYSVIYIDFYPINGDFQAFNPIRRLQAGYVIARDFNIYLGLGLTYFSYALYSVIKLLGLQDIQSSYLTFSILGFASFLITVGTICYLLNLSRIYFFLIIALTLGSRFFFPLTQSDNSLLIVRALAASLTTLAFLHLSPNLLKFKATLLIGGLSGLALAWSPDYGIPTFISMFVGITLVHLKNKKYVQLLWNSLVFGIIASLSYIALGTYLTENHLYEYLTYFSALGKNQMWYFLSGWAQDFKIFVITDIPQPVILLSSLLIIFTLTYFYYYPAALNRNNSLGRSISDTIPRSPQQCLALILLLIIFLVAGYLPQIGGHISDHYLLPLHYFLTIFIFKFFLSLAANCFKSNLNSLGLKRSLLIIFTIFGCYSITARIYLLTYRNYNPDKFYYDSELKLNLRKDYAATMQQAKLINKLTKDIEPNRKIFSTYSSLIEYYLGAFNPSRSDYIIHSLGFQEEVHYLNTFIKTKPIFVSVVNDAGINWGSWNQRVNWPFYKQLYKNYEPFAINWHSIIYQLRSEPNKEPEIEVPFKIKRLASNKILVELDVKSLTKKYGNIYGYAELSYAISRSKNITPIIGKRTYTQVQEFSNTRYNRAQRNKIPLTYIGTKYGLSPKTKEIFFEARPKDSSIYLTFTGFPENESKLELTSFKPKFLMSQTNELKKIPKERLFRY